MVLTLPVSLTPDAGTARVEFTAEVQRYAGRYYVRHLKAADPKRVTTEEELSLAFDAMVEHLLGHPELAPPESCKLERGA